jgi:branched-chain amino acid transport system permease protein
VNPEPRRGWTAVLLLAVLLALAALPLLVGPFYVRVALAMCISAGLALSWYVLGGFSAYYSFGHTAFVGIGAFAAGLLQQAWPQQHWAGQLALALAGGAVVCAVLAAAISWPILRLRGHYFTIAMLAVALVCAEVVSAFPALKGSIGLALPNVAPPGVRPERFYFWAALGLLAVTTAVAWTMSRSRLGYGLYAIREDEDAAQMLGVPTTRIKITAFVVSAALTGSYGALYALNLGYITTDSVFRGALSLEMIVNCLVGGMGSIFGPIVGAVAMTALTKLALADMLEYHLAITGLVVVLVVWLAPEGILGSIARWRRNRAGQAPAPAAVAAPAAQRSTAGAAAQVTGSEVTP